MNLSPYPPHLSYGTSAAALAATLIAWTGGESERGGGSSIEEANPGHEQHPDHQGVAVKRLRTCHPVMVPDMPGNVAEWCQDMWAAQLPGGVLLDPQGPDIGLARVVRGGFFGNWDVWRGPKVCRSATRGGIELGLSDGAIGFRAVLAPSQP